MGRNGRRATEQLSGNALRAATGRDWDGWFAILDDWGAVRRGHTEIARRLREELGVGSWYAQSITVGYEQERGLREVGQTSRGDFEVGVSKVINATAAEVLAAFVDQDLRRSWLPEGDLAIRTHRPATSLTADWNDGAGGRISVVLTVTSTPLPKTRVSLSHTGLPDAVTAASYKRLWKERLAGLKALLETSRTPAEAGTPPEQQAPERQAPEQEIPGRETPGREPPGQR